MSQKIIVIGNGPAGMSAAGAARLTDRSAEITVIDTKDYDTYHPCAMPFVIGGYLPSIESIIENLNYEMNKITLLKSSLVTDVNLKERKVVVKNKSGEEQTLEYDKLVVCTGSKVFIPPIPGRDLDNVFSLKFAEDAEAIKKAALGKNVKEVVVVGGSAIGIEVASELIHLGKKVTIIEMEPQLMPFKISSGFAKSVKEYLEETGIEIKTDMLVKEIIGKKSVEKIKYGSDDVEETINAQVVVLATGVRANADLAKDIGLKVHEKFRAIEVNEKMETNIEGVYAAGDCVTVNNLITKDQNLAQLAGPAVRQARVAGINAAGGNASYPGNVNAFIVSSRTFIVGLAGINEEQAKEIGIEPITAKLSAHIRPHYMPNSKEITLKLIANVADGKILGLEAIGEEKVDENVNYIAIAIQAGLTVYDIMDIDFCYAPAVSETIYPLVKVADAIIRKIERKKSKST
ncbi:MAG TPA: FAD-dependent oxidoreductase [candidate division Zixibacteria bacterium]|nr:FAD-dependent oxidoreductase [candidate division Zixibacteria bacterium]